MPVLEPTLFTTLKGCTRQQFLADAMAGVIVGVVALPLAIAFAIASGVSLERGLYTAAIGGLLISALGGSLVQIGGPTGALIVVFYEGALITRRAEFHGLEPWEFPEPPLPKMARRVMIVRMR